MSIAEAGLDLKAHALPHQVEEAIPEKRNEPPRTIHTQINSEPITSERSVTNAEDLLADGVIETLMENQRIPQIITPVSGRREFSPYGAHIVVPPPGTRIGDTLSIDSREPLRVSVWPLEGGHSRGEATVFDASHDQVQEVRKRKAQARSQPKS